MAWQNFELTFCQETETGENGFTGNICRYNVILSPDFSFLTLLEKLKRFRHEEGVRQNFVKLKIFCVFCPKFSYGQSIVTCFSHSDYNKQTYFTESPSRVFETLLTSLFWLLPWTGTLRMFYLITRLTGNASYMNKKNLKTVIKICRNYRNRILADSYYFLHNQLKFHNSIEFYL